MKLYLTPAFLLIGLLFSELAIAKRSEQKNLGDPIDPNKIEIVRDKWGVPHIFAEKDREVAYGLAWANAEDDFFTMQEMVIAGQGRSGELLGKDGAKRDFILHAIGAKELVEREFPQALSEDFIAYMQGYCQGLNAYAAKHPEQQALWGVFPVGPKDLLQTFVFMSSVVSGVHTELGKAVSGSFGAGSTWLGSNAMAVNSNMSADGSTMLCINPHQPMEGPFSWYEAHLCSEEGLNILGALFPGGLSIFLGSNEDLGWAHTVNKLDLVDVYKLKMHPKKHKWYMIDGEWKKLEPRPVRIKVNLSSILTLPVWKRTYWSDFGPTIRSKDGNFYALRFAANMDIRGQEQMYRLNKASSFNEFKEAIEMQAYVRYNIIYGDRDGNVMYLNNGLIPKRNEAYSWDGLLPGDTSSTLWTEFHPVADLPQVTNPECGIVFNTNNTPFNATCSTENLNEDDFADYFGFDPGDNNRSRRLVELLADIDKVTLDDLKRIKFDSHYPDSSVFLTSLEAFNNINPESYPEISETLSRMQGWDKCADKYSEEAGMFLLTYQYIFEKLNVGVNSFFQGFDLPESTYVEAVEHAHGHLMEYFNTIDVTLGELQRHVKGNVDYPISGFPDALAASYSLPWGEGKFKSFVGDSYVQFATWKDDEPVKLETLHPYGSSNRPNSPHYTDQMRLYADQETKHMTLDKDEIYQNAEQVYNPE